MTTELTDTRIAETPATVGLMPEPVSRPPADRLAGAATPRAGDLFLSLLARGSAVVVLLMLGALILVLAWAARPSIKAFGLKFFTESAWRPNDREVTVRDANGRIVRDEDGEPLKKLEPAHFGALPVIYGTTASSAIALLIAVPLSLGAALFLVRLAPSMRIWVPTKGGGVDLSLLAPVSFLIEFLAAIPSIAYGIWGLFVLGPFLANHIEPSLQSSIGRLPLLGRLFTDAEGHAIPLTGRDMFCGGVILSIMIIPIITAISRDVLRAVPRAQVEGTQALGATWWQSSREMLHYSRSGLFGAVMLGLARAAGETMAVAMVIGNVNQIRATPFAPAQTMSSLLANEFAETASEIHRSALVEVALILLLMSLVFNVVARYLVVGGGSRSAMAH
jgi:phosphate transport system permease protein